MEKLESKFAHSEKDLPSSSLCLSGSLSSLSPPSHWRFLHLTPTGQFDAPRRLTILTFLGLIPMFSFQVLRAGLVAVPSM
ncbi:hypothetical protein FA15DRAFT_435752 [Coprinopsis marcescibilis]|uniref:Uncharacterized protein n=1 Tax=Coprinopsis marcescibilis TaxID=230819 RepID=A0A5C3KUR8_COPMA|nr:hypothetical protein FA15DRAFT_435752 [Coprinopsis marcescibilis]